MSIDGEPTTEGTSNTPSGATNTPDNGKGSPERDPGPDGTKPGEPDIDLCANPMSISKTCASLSYCLDHIARAGLRAPMKKCYLAFACTDRGPESRLESLAEPYLGDPAYVAYDKTCVQRHDACGDKISSRYPCRATSATIRPSLLAKMAECYAKSCNDVNACLDDVVASVGCLQD